MSRPIKDQQGTVLIIALLVVAVITGLAVNFSSRFQLSMARAEQRLYSGQLKQCWLSAESFTLWGLEEDKEVDNRDHGGNYDHLLEDWAKEVKDLPMGETCLLNYARLEDAQGRFNLNQLDGRPQNYKQTNPFETRYTPQQKRFIRLLQTIPGDLVGSGEAEAITEAVIDWVDTDSSVTGAGGAENDYYLSKEQPHRAANRFFISTSELRLIRGMTEELYAWLKPLVVALPDPAASININTASKALMQTLNQPVAEVPLQLAEAETLISSRETHRTQTDHAFEKSNDFLVSNEVQSVFGSDPKLWPNEQGLTTGSNFFLMTAEIEIAGVKRLTHSLFLRDKDKNGALRVRVIRRGTGEVL